MVDDYQRDRESPSAGAIAGDERLAINAESRVFPICTVVAVVAMLVILPGRYRLLPEGFDIGIGVALAFSIALTQFSGNPVSARIERWGVIGFACIATAIEIGILARLLYDMTVHNKAVDALTLLTTAVVIWITNVAVFALVYWEVDRGGPAGRSSHWQGRADISFPRGEPEDGVPADWMPSFPDYLFLAFTAATAFSPTDALPLTVRAKMIMMAQSAISLVTVVAVAARAINILGS